VSSPTNRERYFALIRRPIVTEKSTVLQDLRNQYTFEVAKHANKREIKKAVEALFDVHVEAVNVMNMPSKMHRVLGRHGLRAEWKKALVKLRKGDAIEIV
jgi:large subunit ribosomal protein L23